MTRINAFIPPEELTNKHLLAEHREIKRIPNTIMSGKAKLTDIPSKFSLGKGHVKFFYNKLAFLKNRYETIYAECMSRGFNVTYYGMAFDITPENSYLFNDWSPGKDEIKRVQSIIRERILSRLS